MEGAYLAGPSLLVRVTEMTTVAMLGGNVARFQLGLNFMRLKTLQAKMTLDT
jgi:hypothetical protein